MIDFQRHHQIYHLLSIRSTPLSSEEIAQFIGVSVRTIKDDMHKVEQFAFENGGRLCSKRGAGYWLEIVDSALFSRVFFQLKIRNAYSTDLQRLSNNFETIDVMQYIISQEGYFKIETIAEMFYIPKNLVSEVIKSLKTLLSAYDLDYVTRPNYGNIIIGDEFKRRIAMLMLFDIHFHKVEMERPVKSFYQYFEADQDELNKTRLILLSTLRRHHYRIHDDYSQCLSRYLVLQKKRNQAGFTLSLSESDKTLLKQFSLPLKVAQEIFESLAWVNQDSYGEDDVLTLVLLLLLWSDYALSDTMADLYQPLCTEIESLVQAYLSTLEQQFNCYQHGFSFLKPFLRRRLSPLIIHYKFGCAGFDIKGGNFVDQRKLSEIGASLMHVFNQLMKTNYQCTFSNYLLQKLAVDITNLIQQFPLYEPVNLLISSIEGVEGAKYIEHKLKEVYNPSLFGEVVGIELYEGRAIPTEEFDFMILDSLDAMFYAYDWPVYSLRSNFNYDDLHEVMEVIIALAKEKKRYNHPFLNSLSIETKTTTPSKFKAMVAQRQQYETFTYNQNLYFYDASLPLNTCIHYKTTTRKQTQANQHKGIIRLNVQVQNFEELALFSDWLTTIR